MDVIVSMSNEELNVWEKSIDFTSLRNIWIQISKAEDEYEQKIIESEINPETVEVRHSSLYFKYLEKEIIKEISDSEGDYYVLNIPEFSNSYVLNEYGQVTIAGVTYEYSEDGIYELTDGRKELIKDKYSKGFHSISRTSDWKYNGKKRLKISVYHSEYVDGIQAYTAQCRYDIDVVLEKKNIWGNWKPADGTYMSMYGSWKANAVFFDLDGFDDYSESYSKTYSYNWSGNCYRGSIEITNGYGRPPYTTFRYRAPSGYAYNIGPRINDFYWSISAAGITAVVVD